MSSVLAVSEEAGAVPSPEVDNCERSRTTRLEPATSKLFSRDWSTLAPKSLDAIPSIDARFSAETLRLRDWKGVSLPLAPSAGVM